MKLISLTILTVLLVSFTVVNAYYQTPYVQWCRTHADCLPNLKLKFPGVKYWICLYDRMPYYGPYCAPDNYKMFPRQ
uniref:Secreted protein n=1 Tax=Panagrellus redivivus TaxID=6233 RepID=A0A7E4V4Z2_PANRE